MGLPLTHIGVGPEMTRWTKLELDEKCIIVPIAFPKPYMRPLLHMAPLWLQINVRIDAVLMYYLHLCR